MLVTVAAYFACIELAVVAIDVGRQSRTRKNVVAETFGTDPSNAVRRQQLRSVEAVSSEDIRRVKRATDSVESEGRARGIRGQSQPRSLDALADDEAYTADSEGRLGLTAGMPVAWNISVGGVLNANAGRNVGEIGVGTDACQDISQAQWTKRDGLWGAAMTTDTSKFYGCGNCSASCTPYADYRLIGLEKCPTRHLTKKPVIDCSLIRKRIDPIQIALYGSSHTRVLAFHLMRLLTDESWGEWPNALPKEFTDQAHGGSYAKHAHQYHTFDLCDGKVPVEVVYGFKRWYFTKENDETFLEILNGHNMREPDLLISEASVWSEWEDDLWWDNPALLNGYKAGNDTDALQRRGVSLEDERDYYLNWLAHQFANKRTFTIMQLGSGESPGAKPFDKFMRSMRLVGKQNPGWSACGFDKESLGRPPDKMICGHGCDGPVVMIQAQAILHSVFKHRVKGIRSSRGFDTLLEQEEQEMEEDEEDDG